MNKDSYINIDLVSESLRLRQQFLHNWKWEKLILNNLGIKPHAGMKKALVYGCGSGTDASTLLKENYAHTVEGWDYLPLFIDKARTQYPDANLTFKCADLTNDVDFNISTLESTFDFIYIRLVLMHIKKGAIYPLLDKCCALLNKDGLLVVHDTDRFKTTVDPEDHAFNLIDYMVLNHLHRCDNVPDIGSKAPSLFKKLGLVDINCEEYEKEGDLDATIKELVYADNIADLDDSRRKLISDYLWSKACNNRIENFKRKTYRVITVGKKPSNSRRENPCV